LSPLPKSISINVHKGCHHVTAGRKRHEIGRKICEARENAVQRGLKADFEQEQTEQAER